MNNKREKERDELHKTIWKIADEFFIYFTNKVSKSQPKWCKF